MLIAATVCSCVAATHIIQYFPFSHFPFQDLSAGPGSIIAESLESLLFIVGKLDEGKTLKNNTRHRHKGMCSTTQINFPWCYKLSLGHFPEFSASVYSHTGIKDTEGFRTNPLHEAACITSDNRNQNTNYE